MAFRPRESSAVLSTSVDKSVHVYQKDGSAKDSRVCVHGGGETNECESNYCKRMEGYNYERWEKGHMSDGGSTPDAALKLPPGETKQKVVLCSADLEG